MTGNEQYSNEELLKDLNRVADELGKSPSFLDYSNHGEYSPGVFQRRFGSWNNAKEEAGLESYSQSGNAKASIEEIVAELEDGKSLREIADKYGYSSVQRVSNRLADHGLKIRSRVSKNKSGYAGDGFAGIVSIPGSVLEELSIQTVEDTFYDIQPVDDEDEKGVKITFHSSRVKQVNQEDGGENLE